MATDLGRAAQLFKAGQAGQVMARHQDALVRASRTRDRWDSRWEGALEAPWAALEPPDPEALYRAGERAWEARSGGRAGLAAKLTKKAPREPSQPPAAVRAGLAAAAVSAMAGGGQPGGPGGDVFAAVEEAVAAQSGTAEGLARAALPVYMSLATDTSEDAGQSTLEVLGLDSTFRWTGVRDLPRDMFQVRGSKIIQRAHGTHVGRLRDLVVAATDPSAPWGVQALQRAIRGEWPSLTRPQVARIARTESAAVWETTNFNAARCNDVARFDWVVGHGPSIGAPVSEEVCLLCLERAAAGPYDAEAGEVPIPPRHPNCRCTLVPALDETWLPPIELWNGGPNPPLPLVPAPDPEAA